MTTTTTTKVSDDDLGPILKYVPFQSTAEPSFWLRLGEHKLNTLKLSEDPITISASYGIIPVSFTSRNNTNHGEQHQDNNNINTQVESSSTTGLTKTNDSTNVVFSAGRMRLDQDSITDTNCIISNSDTGNCEDNSSYMFFNNELIVTTGKIVIMNTVEGFKNIDKNLILNQYCLPSILETCGISSSSSSQNENKNDTQQHENLTSLCSFFVLSFLDLKNHKVVYWFAFPALVPSPGKTIRYAKPSEDDTDNANTPFSYQSLLRNEWGSEKLKKLHHSFHQLRISIIHQTQEQQQQQQSSRGCPPFFLLVEKITTNRDKGQNNDVEIECLELSLYNYNRIIQQQQQQQDNTDNKDIITKLYFAFIDPTIQSISKDNSDGMIQAAPVGWTLRNLIAYLTFKLNMEGQSVSIISFRPGILRRIQNLDGHDKDKNNTTILPISDRDISHDSSLLLQLQLPKKNDYIWPVGGSTRINPDEQSDDTTTSTTYMTMGWELNARNKNGPRSINLAPLLSPAHLIQQATDLNLKLMKWRMIPNLNLNLLSDIHVLLLGAGTLGCSVARTLLGWGVRKFTFVDNGKVSYSNPVRQNLFELKDCEEGGAEKAKAAADALKRIAGPTIQSDGVVLTIPMPGHPFTAKEEDAIGRDVSEIQRLIDNCDVVFLLTDTRESRWLPTVMARASNKMMINAALGLDSWLVIRHGGNDSDDSRLGCYFCNDIVAPENSTNNRTLDQQCTVTRPGLAPIASSMAVELMVSLLHHEQKQNAPAPMPQQKPTSFSPTLQASQYEASSPLGIMPHQIRGSLVSYSMMTPTVPAFNCCTGCCDSVVDRYKEEKFEFVKKVCCCVDGSYLENISGLTKFRQDAASKLEDCMDDWEEDDSSEDDN